MHWTATQRFVFLGLQLAREGDGEVQAAERDMVVEAARAMAMACHVDKKEADAWIEEAAAAFDEAATDGMIAPLIEDSIEALGSFSPEIRRALVHSLREVAKASDGVNQDEHAWIEDLRATWGDDKHD